MALYGGDRLTNLRRRVDGGIANTRLEYTASTVNRPARLVLSSGDCATSSCETSFTLAYDVRGNRTTETPTSGQGAGSISRKFTYGPDNRLRRIRAASPKTPDVNCSPTQWDQLDTDVGYDQVGLLAYRRRRLGTVDQASARYIRTPSGEIAYSTQAGATGSQRVTYKYLHLAGQRVVAVRETWNGAQRTSRKYLFLHSDRNGSPVAAYATDHLDTEGSQQWSANRDPWGWTKIGGAFPTDEVPFEFPGQARLDGTEVKRLVPGTNGCETKVIQPAIVSNGFRDYDPVSGVYLNRDPIALVGLDWSGNPKNRNLYAYAGFNPVDGVDYWGLEIPGSNPILIAAGFLPYVGPVLGMHDALVRGDWTMAVVNLGFLAWDITAFGSGSLARGGLRLGVGLAARKTVFKGSSGAVRVTCEMLERQAAEGGAETFEILDGVRRAKAAEMAGLKSIPAEVQVGGKTVGKIDVPIDALRSPKAAIDVSNLQKAQRFSSTLQKTQAGSIPPPIQIQPGVRGTAIPDVTFQY